VTQQLLFETLHAGTAGINSHLQPLQSGAQAQLAWYLLLQHSVPDGSAAVLDVKLKVCCL
jgi:hypothetical protein